MAGDGRLGVGGRRYSSGIDGINYAKPKASTSQSPSYTRHGADRREEWLLSSYLQYLYDNIRYRQSPLPPLPSSLLPLLQVRRRRWRTVAVGTMVSPLLVVGRWSRYVRKGLI